MKRSSVYPWLLAGLVTSFFFLGSTASNAQVRRYQPSRPTVSPYLNLFRERTGVVPNYYTLVRPFQDQYHVNQLQQQYMRQQNQVIQQLQTDVYGLQKNQAAPVIAPTGTGSWFGQPGSRNTFMNTSRYYSQSGGALGPAGGMPRR
jgi:hypothetical protein